MKRRGRAYPARRRAIAFCILIAVLALRTSGLAPAAPSQGVQNARRALINAGLHPSPLYPTHIPRKISCCSADLSIQGNKFNVSFTNGHRNPVLVDYGRLGKRAMRQLVKMAHAQGHRVRRVRVGGRSVRFARTDVTFFYAWRAQGSAYVADSHYTGHVHPRDLRTMVASAQPLPRR